jgi:hypothetical protein
MQLHLGHSLDVLTEFRLQYVRCDLQILALFVVTLSVQEPARNTTSLGVSDDVSDLFGLLLCQFTYITSKIPALSRGLILRILQMR